MVKGQMMTLEGIMGAMLLFLVTYTLFQSSLVISPLWSEFSDAQLKQLAYDSLRILDGSSGLNDSLKGMLLSLNSSFTPNQDFINSLEKLIRPANYRLEIYWVNNSKIEKAVLVDNRPTPEAIAASRIVVLKNGDLSPSSPFYRAGAKSYTPIVVEVRLIVWRA